MKCLALFEKHHQFEEIFSSDQRVVVAAASLVQDLPFTVANQREKHLKDCLASSLTGCFLSDSITLAKQVFFESELKIKDKLYVLEHSRVVALVLLKRQFGGKI